MKKQEKKLLISLGNIDDKYLDQAKPRKRENKTPQILTVAASLVLVVGISLWVLLSGMLGQGGNGGGIIGDSGDEIIGGNGVGDIQPPINNHPFGDDRSDYSEIIAAVDRFKNHIGNDLFVGDGSVDDESAEGGTGTGSSESNGEYIENTDNQVDGVVEGDLMKMTDKYIFRIAYEGTDTGYQRNRTYVIKVFSVDKENSALISEYKIPDFGGKIASYGWEMHLSKDCSLITLIVNYSDADGNDRIGVSSLDISDVRNIREAASFSIDGNAFTTRMVDGKLLLFTNQYYSKVAIDTSDYATFIPSVKRGDEIHFINPDRFVVPCEIVNSYSLSYTTVLMVNEKGLDIIDSAALIGYTDAKYISENNIFLTREYTVTTYFDEESGFFENLSDISVIGYSNTGFEIKDTVTIKGSINDQYSLDEKDGYLRVVASTLSGDLQKYRYFSSYWWRAANRKRNASLYVIDLSDYSMETSVENFAPWGEDVASARFEGDKLYVCTAVIRLFTDPVYFFDLSDYGNITYTDTGFIEGFSTSLIDLGEGYLLGIGKESSAYSKLEVYKKDGNGVVSVNKMLFDGSYSTEYKEYLINRGHNLFGFTVYDLYDSETKTFEIVYLIVQLNEGKLEVVEKIPLSGPVDTGITRAAMVDGYVYITTYFSCIVEKVDI